jgi:hypothetical protein
VTCGKSFMNNRNTVCAIKVISVQK